jgi:hypothetical protein
MLRYEKYHLFGFIRAMGKEGVKRPVVVVKTSVNHPRALASAASRLDRASPSLSRPSSILKRLGFYALADSCIKLVRTTHLTMPTYIFNCCYHTGDTVNGGLRKKSVAD